ncbi:V-set and immunoglobulin domain-containing protein 4 precursor [Camelus ferus]|nr:V-set and immunoglobulin domain-containing protein 4 precursor [Camelus ferus]
MPQSDTADQPSTWADHGPSQHHGQVLHSCQEGGWQPALSQSRSLHCSVLLLTPPRVHAPYAGSRLCLAFEAAKPLDFSKPLEIKTKAPTTMQSPVEATSRVNSSWGWTTKADNYLEKTSAGPGKGLPIFAIILIISLCCLVVITMAYIILCRKTSQQDVYEVTRVHAREASDSGETMRVAIFVSGCSSEEAASQTLGNNYSDEPCLGQECQIITQINSDYAHLLHTVPMDYEFLATKDKSVC